MERGSSRGRRLASGSAAAKEPGPGQTTAMIEIAHSSPDRGGTGGMVERGEAGLPEHMAPEHGAGRCRGASPSGVESAPAVPSRIRSGMLPGLCDRELTCGLVQPASADEGQTIPVARSISRAPTQ
jgi:hypothetical protein